MQQSYPSAALFPANALDDEVRGKMTKAGELSASGLMQFPPALGFRASQPTSSRMGIPRPEAIEAGRVYSCSDDLPQGAHGALYHKAHGGETCRLASSCQHFMPVLNNPAHLMNPTAGVTFLPSAFIPFVFCCRRLP